jgi:hypothetical protein
LRSVPSCFCYLQRSSGEHASTVMVFAVGLEVMEESLARCLSRLDVLIGILLFLLDHNLKRPTHTIPDVIDVTLNLADW